MRYAQKQETLYKREIQTQKKLARMNKRKSNSVNLRKMPEDSVSEITELEKEEILTRYYDAVLTPK